MTFFGDERNISIYIQQKQIFLHTKNESFLLPPYCVPGFAFKGPCILQFHIVIYAVCSEL